MKKNIKMKISNLKVYLECNDFDDDAEILIEDDGGLLHDFSLSVTEPAFDGFDGYTPAGIKLTPKD